MEQFTITKEVNLYKTKDATRRSGTISVDSKYLIDSCLPDGADSTYRTKVYLVAGADAGQIGWVNLKDFLDVAIYCDDEETSNEEEVVTDTADQEEHCSSEISAGSRVNLKVARPYSISGQPIPQWFSQDLLVVKVEGNLAYVQSNNMVRDFLINDLEVISNV